LPPKQVTLSLHIGAWNKLGEQARCMKHLETFNFMCSKVGSNLGSTPFLVQNTSKAQFPPMPNTWPKEKTLFY